MGYAGFIQYLKECNHDAMVEIRKIRTEMSEINKKNESKV